MSTKSARDVAAKCRKLAEALDALPADTPLPTHISVYTHDSAPTIGWLLFEDDAGYQLDVARRVVDSIGGTWDKVPGDFFRFQRVFRGVEIEVVVKREAVCRRVVTGVETVTKSVPDPSAPMVEVTEQVEQVVWECQPLLTREAVVEVMVA